MTTSGGGVPRAGHHAAGTDEQVWRDWDGWAVLRPVSVPGPGTRVVVLAAHPDDEVLGVGGLLARLACLGCDLLFVTATDGEASHPGSPTLAPEELAARRSREHDAALVALGHAGAERMHLHLPDSGLVDRERELTDRLQLVLGDAGLVLAPWSGDGHPDHEACGRAARRACAELAAVTAAVGGAGHDRALWEYPVWAWHWSGPGDDAVPWRRTRAVRLDPHERLAKREAVDCFGSQLEPLGPDLADAAVLPPPVRAHFDRPHEIVVV